MECQGYQTIEIDIEDSKICPICSVPVDDQMSSLVPKTTWSDSVGIIDGSNDLNGRNMTHQLKKEIGEIVERYLSFIVDESDIVDFPLDIHFAVENEYITWMPIVEKQPSWYIHSVSLIISLFMFHSINYPVNFIGMLNTGNVDIHLNVNNTMLKIPIGICWVLAMTIENIAIYMDSNEFVDSQFRLLFNVFSRKFTVDNINRSTFNTVNELMRANVDIPQELLDSLFKMEKNKGEI
jgi:hypothetical protein